MVALTPHLAEHSRAMIEKRGLAFDMLSDPGNAYAAELGLRFQVPPEVQEIYGGNILLDADFTRERVERELAESDPMVVHVASHAEFGGDPETTYLLMHDRKMNMSELSDVVGPASAGPGHRRFSVICCQPGHTPPLPRAICKPPNTQELSSHSPSECRYTFDRPTMGGEKSAGKIQPGFSHAGRRR